MLRLASTACATAVLASGVLLAPSASAAEGAAAAAPHPYTNCTALQTKYPHGLGKKGAVDKTSGKRVTTFKKDTKKYKKAIAANSRLDADKDGIACEKR